MKISDHRYRRDLRRYFLAHRLLCHEARTSTIAKWSGLSGYQIRTLHEGYTAQHAGVDYTRHRGVPPYTLRFFFEADHRRCEAATVAGICRALEVLPADRLANPETSLYSLDRGERLCLAYEIFRAYMPASELTIDHAVLLVAMLAAGEEAALERCERCSGLVLIDRLALEAPQCAWCA